MNDLSLTYGGIDYLDRLPPLLDGTVKPAGISLRIVPFIDPWDLFRRVVRHSDFDAAEMSFSTYANLVSRGDDRYIAIPFFPSRAFRHGDIYVHRDSGISQPADLREKKVGIPQYQMTAALWQRAFLQYDYGVLPREIHWYTGGLTSPGQLEPNAIPNLPGITIDLIPDSKTLEGSLAEGELSVLFSPNRPAALLNGSGRIRRLFPNYREVEQEYYRRTGFFPIMHLVVVRRPLYQEHPWVAASLLQAFAQAQRLGWERLQAPGALRILLPWLTAEIEATTVFMGPNHWKQGFAENQTILDTMCRYHYDQGLSERPLNVEELFVRETHEITFEY
jgi:4,5-dihydroxyphthalate decarboxylase